MRGVARRPPRFILLYSSTTSSSSSSSSETSSSNSWSSGIDYGQAEAQRKAEEAQRRQAEIEKQKRDVNFKACTSLINPEKYAQEYKELLQKESKEYNEYINQFPSLNWLTADEQLLFQHSDFLESFTEQEKIKLIVLGRERSITMDDIKKLYIDEDLTNKGVMDFFNTSLRANRFGMTTTDLDTHFQQGKKAERSALLDFAGMYAAAGLIANYNASGSNFSNVPERQFKGFNLDKPKVGGGNESKVPRTGEEWNQYFKEKYSAENVTWETASIRNIVNMPSKITSFSPQQVANLAKSSGWSVEPLGKGSLAGVPYEEGGGFSMRAPNGGSEYIQYHPGGGHHGSSPYYKISSGPNGTVRYDINGGMIP
ncbi:hypothetical protein RBG61_00390 [Paludicola sp. MB14-C6]|uniref:hypothetical protein n=1 Tax=Paludihabitans sp. MB14-C6 TaxID=3070656 RepID=UPI0027DC5348|nr:hypothetical protein [Paludicola sp. MB14-C6]WMJ23149.1 hypothetical protein RBG61_00390 [Paludicola sp. MB14-C6]